MSDMSQAPDQSGQDQGQGQGDSDQSKVCVCIEVDPKTGAVTVGLDDDSQDTDGSEEGGEDYNMQPAANIDDALRMAKKLLTQALQGGASASNPQDQAAFEQGFQQTAGGGTGAQSY